MKLQLAQAATDSGSLTPYIPIIVAVISVMGMGVFAAWNRRRGAVETKAPSVAEAWKQAAAANDELDLEREARRWFQTAFWDLVEAFTGYHRRVIAGGSKELRAHEKRALEAKPPNIEKETSP